MLRARGGARPCKRVAYTQQGRLPQAQARRFLRGVRGVTNRFVKLLRPKAREGYAARAICLAMLWPLSRGRI